jgi:putative transposase
MPYPSDLADAQWAAIEPVLNASSKRGRRHTDLRLVVDALLYIAHTGCQWRYLPEGFGPWIRAWSQFRRWRDNGTLDRLLSVVHTSHRVSAGREPDPSMIVVDTHLARGDSNGGATFHDKGGPYGATKGAKRVVAVDVTGLPVAATVVPASTNDGTATEGLLDRHDFGDRLELVIVDRGVNLKQAGRIEHEHSVRVDRVGWDEPSPMFRPIRHAWRVEVAHGQLGRSRRLAKSFENSLASAGTWLTIACIGLHLRLVE